MICHVASVHSIAVLSAMVQPLICAKSTTITTRVWCTDAIKQAQEIIVARPDLLPYRLRNLVRLAKAENGGFPGWLIHGLAARHFLGWLEEQLTRTDFGQTAPQSGFDSVLPPTQTLVTEAASVKREPVPEELPVTKSKTKPASKKKRASK